MPPEGDAATMSPQRCIAMPSPAWSRRSRRRDLVTLDQDKKSAEVALGQTVHKKSEVPLVFDRQERRLRFLLTFDSQEVRFLLAVTRSCPR